MLHAGYQAWIADSLTVTTQLPTPKSKNFPINEDSANLMLAKEEMLEALQNTSIVKLDVRDVDEWGSASSSPYGIDYCPRKGRIPGAVWLEWYRMMKPGKQRRIP